MNYRHAYHAGGIADCHKHAALVLLLEALARKDKGFAVLDTHAGIGSYDLAGPEAAKTGEWQAGIGRLLALDPAPRPLARYLEIVRAFGPGHYPGSPAVARACLRPQDRLILVELHPQDLVTLRRTMGGDPRVAIHHRNGYEAWVALTPPAERRGLVLVDPPFEVAGELERLAAGLVAAHRKWPGGTQLLWYPLKDRLAVAAFHGELALTGIRRILVAELDIGIGSGLVVVNPPWQSDLALGQLMPALADALGGRWRLEWLVPE